MFQYMLDSSKHSQGYEIPCNVKNCVSVGGAGGAFDLCAAFIGVMTNLATIATVTDPTITKSIAND
jgi:hypothetical protein